MIEEAKLKFALALLTITAITVGNGAMETPSLVGNKTINACSHFDNSFVLTYAKDGVALKFHLF